MKTILTFAAAASLGLGLAACDSSTENAVEEQAEAFDERAETQAEQLGEAGMDDQAEIVEETGEEVKDQLEERADDMDDTPQ